ncbi:MAG: acyl-CoA dehydrogenase family protein, partial [Planctomycetes bacterium]|nr:acyl-CoA dehydrogenase family protein [Planctomycetota bacterium]
MNLELTEDQRLLAESVRDFAANRVAPGAADRDREASMPESLRTELAEMGFLGICIPEEYGGTGMDVVSS